MKLKIYTTIIILALNFNLAFSQNVNYVPSSAKAVLSFNINSVINKLGKNYREIIRDVIRNSGGKVDYRDGQKIEKLINSLDLEEDVRIILHGVSKDFNNIDISAVIPYRNVSQLKEFIYEFFEDSYIRNYFSGNIEYFEIDDTTVMAIGNNVLCFSYSASGTYVAYSYLNEIVGNKSPLRDKTFLELEKKVNDMALWIDSDYIYRIGLLEEGYSMYNNMFYKSSYGASLNFNQGYIILEIEQYFPKNPFGQIKKKINSKVAQLVDTYNILGFFSFSFSSRKFNEMVKNNFAYTEIDRGLRNEIANGMTGYDLIDMFGGDCSGIVVNDNGNPTFVAAASLNNQTKFINYLLENDNDMIRIGNNEYWGESADANFYVSDSTIYICDSTLPLNRLRSILNNRSNSDNYSKFAFNNDASFFFNIDKSYKLFKEGGELDILVNELHYISGSVNVENNNSIKTVMRLNFKNTNQNSLATLIDILSRISY